MMFALAAALILGAAAVPVTAFLIVPQFVRSTISERAPGEHATASADAAGAAVVTRAPTAAGASGSRVLAAGELRRINSVDFGSGKVVILEVGDKRFLRFENVEIAGAPAQRVYLSDRSDGEPGTFTDLGPLKATNGSFNYEIPATVDVSRVRSVVSYCKQFSVTITYAVLQPA